MYLCSRIIHKYFKDMKTFNFVFGLLIALLACVFVVLLSPSPPSTSPSVPPQL